jgi:hypothetical protein
MPDPRAEALYLLRRDGATELKSKNHRKFKLSTGALYVMPKTGTCDRGAKDDLCTLRRLLGLRPSDSPKESTPKVRQRKPGITPRKKFLSDLKPVEYQGGLNFRQKLKRAIDPAAPEPEHPDPPKKKTAKSQPVEIIEVLSPPITPKVRRERTRHLAAPARIATPAFIAEANRILHEQGSDAYEQFLKHADRSMYVETVVIKPHHHKESTMLDSHTSTLEKMVEAARARKDSVQATIAEADNRIAQAQKDKEAATSTLADIDEFIGAYEMAQSAGKKIENSLAPAMRLSLLAGGPKTNAIGKRLDVLPMVEKLFEDYSGKSWDTESLHREISKADPTITRASITNKLMYLHSKNDSPIERTGRGMYRKRQAVKANGHQAALHATA